MTEKKISDRRDLPDWLNTLSFSEILIWIEELLTFKAELSSSPYLYPHMILFEASKQINRDIRRNIEDVLLQFLSEFSQDQMSKWNSEAGEELLLSISKLFWDSERAREPIVLLMYIAQERRDLIDSEPDLYYRALQTIVGLEYDAGQSFWKQIYVNYSVSPDVVLAGLLLGNVEMAFDWIAEEISEPGIFDALLAMLPLLKEDYGPQELGSYMQILLPHLRTIELTQINELLEQLDIFLPTSILTGLGIDDLVKLADQLGIKQKPKDKEELCKRIDAKLREDRTSINKAPIADRDIELLYCIHARILLEVASISQELREHFANYAELLLSRRNFGEHNIEILVVIDSIKTHNIEVLGRLEETMDDLDPIWKNDEP